MVKKATSCCASSMHLVITRNDKHNGKLLYKCKLSSTIYYKKISSCFEKSISIGCVNAMYKYGKMLLYGSIFPIYQKRGFEYIKKTAEKEHPIALYIYSIMIMLIDQKSSMEYMRKSAYKGYPLAIGCYNGIKVTKNEVEALKYYKMADVDKK